MAPDRIASTKQETNTHNAKNLKRFFSTHLITGDRDDPERPRLLIEHAEAVRAVLRRRALAADAGADEGDAGLRRPDDELEPLGPLAAAVAVDRNAGLPGAAAAAAAEEAGGRVEAGGEVGDEGSDLVGVVGDDMDGGGELLPRPLLGLGG